MFLITRMLRLIQMEIPGAHWPKGPSEAGRCAPSRANLPRLGSLESALNRCFQEQ